MQHLAANMLRGPSALGTSLRGKDRVPRAALVAERPAAVLLSPLKGPPRQAAEHTTTVSYVEAPQVVADEYANERRELELTMGLAQLQQLTAELELALGGAEQASFQHNSHLLFIYKSLILYTTILSTLQAGPAT